MEKQILFNSDLHFEHVQWQSELSFWEDEIKSFKHRLEELVVRWTDKDVLKQLEHYQNEFILHSDVIDELKHSINVHETEMSETDMTDKVSSLNTAHTKGHIAFRQKMETQREIYADLKRNFYSFLSKYM